MLEVCKEEQFMRTVFTLNKATGRWAQGARTYRVPVWYITEPAHLGFRIPLSVWRFLLNLEGVQLFLVLYFKICLLLWVLPIWLAAAFGKARVTSLVGVAWSVYAVVYLSLAVFDRLDGSSYHYVVWPFYVVLVFLVSWFAASNE
jgi:hypothetical protein